MEMADVLRACHSGYVQRTSTPKAAAAVLEGSLEVCSIARSAQRAPLAESCRLGVGVTNRPACRVHLQLRAAERVQASGAARLTERLKAHPAVSAAAEAALLAHPPRAAQLMPANNVTCWWSEAHKLGVYLGWGWCCRCKM